MDDVFFAKHIHQFNHQQFVAGFGDGKTDDSRVFGQQL
jgi:hypothetical protein